MPPKRSIFARILGNTAQESKPTESELVRWALDTVEVQRKNPPGSVAPVYGSPTLPNKEKTTYSDLSRKSLSTLKADLSSPQSSHRHSASPNAGSTLGASASGSGGTAWYAQPSPVDPMTVVLAARDRDLLASVHDRVEELLGKHPYSRLARIRAEIDKELVRRGLGESFNGVQPVQNLRDWRASVSKEIDVGIAETAIGAGNSEMAALEQLLANLRKRSA